MNPRPIPNGPVPPPEPDDVAKEAAELGLPPIPSMGTTLMGPFAFNRSCERSADEIWNRLLNDHSTEVPASSKGWKPHALALVVEAFLVAEGLCHIWLPDRTRMLNVRATLIRSLHAASQKLGLDVINRLARAYGDLVLYRESTPPKSWRELIYGVLGEHAAEHFPAEEFPPKEREMLVALRNAKPGDFVWVKARAQAAAVRRLMTKHRIRIESWKQAKNAGKQVPRASGKSLGYRLIL